MCNRETELLWLIQTLADVPPDNSWLSRREKSVLADMKFPKRRNDWRLGRWTAKRALCACLARRREPARLPEVEIIAAQDGAPEPFLNGSPAPLSLSISHSAGVSLCVVSSSEVPVGCDLEVIEARDDRFMTDYFTGEETAFLGQMPFTERHLYATVIWSAKESALKVIRQGMRRDTRSLTVRVARRGAGGWNRLTVRCEESSREFPGWWRESGNHVLTLASANSGTIVEIVK